MWIDKSVIRGEKTANYKLSPIFVPLEAYEKALKLIRTTKTSTGLKVKAHFVRKHYKTGEKVSDSRMNSLSIKPHTEFPMWNYTLNPITKM
jgi:hypothetical protein